MRNWKSRIRSLIERADHLSDALRSRVRKVTGGNDRLKIVPYLTYGTPSRLLVSGRVLEDQGLTLSSSADRTWRNLVNMYKRFETDEVPGARIRGLFHGVETEAITDREGYFSLELQPREPLDSRPWQQVKLSLLHPVYNGHPVRAAARVLVPSPTAKFGTISDIDDTIIRTHVTSKLKMLLTVILLNAHARKPFEGVAAFYRALQRGAVGRDNNPIFYVSNSAWNLYTLLVEFLSLQKIPLGPILLRNFGDHLLFPTGRSSHKKNNIKMILEMYPDLPFVLIGDSGERDPEIYTEIVREYPDRIRVIYIRSVNNTRARLSAIDKLITEVQSHRTQLVLAPDSDWAAAHAAAEGLIATRELPGIRSETKKDHKAPQRSV